MPSAAGTNDSATNATVWARMTRAAAASLTTLGSIGTPAAA